MAYYLIDFENVKSRGMEGVELLTEEDTVCIFYSDNADSMTFDLHRKLDEGKHHLPQGSGGDQECTGFPAGNLSGISDLRTAEGGDTPELFYRDQGQWLHQPHGVLEGAGSSRADHS